MNDQQNNRMTRDGEANAFILPVEIPCLAKEINQIRTEICQAMSIPPNLLNNGERYDDR